MDMTQPTIETLFEQLGLSGQPADVDAFIAQHRPLADDVLLPNAPFWTPAQSQFLREEFKDDAEWIPVIDQLNVMLRA